MARKLGKSGIMMEELITLLRLEMSGWKERRSWEISVDKGKSLDLDPHIWPSASKTPEKVCSSPSASERKFRLRAFFPFDGIEHRGKKNYPKKVPSGERSTD